MSAAGVEQRAARTKSISWQDPAALAAAGAELSGREFLEAIVDGRLPPPPSSMRRMPRSRSSSRSARLRTGAPSPARCAAARASRARLCTSRGSSTGYVPWILDGAAPEGQQRFMAALPAPVRVINRLLWEPRYHQRGLWKT